MIFNEKRKNYVAKRKIDQEIKKKKKLLSSVSSSQTTRHKDLRYGKQMCNVCILCGSNLKSKKKQLAIKVIKTKQLEASIRNVSKLRKDDWAAEVLGINAVGDLVSNSIEYHHLCSSNFRTWKLKSICFRLKKKKDSEIAVKKGGRRPDDKQIAGFVHATSRLESHPEKTISITTLCEYMAEYGCYYSYSKKHMKRKLIQLYSNKVIISSNNGLSDIITLRVMTRYNGR